MADIFDVIADATRRQIMNVLLDRYLSPASETGEISVGDLVEQLALSQPTVSKHLKVLRDHGLVAVREDGQHRFYHLDSAPLEDIEDWILPFLSADFDSADFDSADFDSADFDSADFDSADFDGDDLNEDIESILDDAALQDSDAAVFAAWSGADVGETIGRKIAEGSHQARTVIHDASEQVQKRLPKRFRHES
jgi:ArsR family transcriptional regulator